MTSVPDHLISFTLFAPSFQLVNTVFEKLGKKLGSRRLLFIEPSCGYGDVVLKLLTSLPPQAKTNVRVVGCDIDPHNIATCRQLPHNDSGLQYLGWICKDFLTTTRNDFDLQGDEYLVCFGGPPYTSGAGSGPAMKTDLPQLFLRHCVDALKAELVAFFLPRRYRANPLQPDDDLACDDDDDSNWTCETRELPSSTFLFQGTSVIQPSIQQCFYRKED